MKAEKSQCKIKLLQSEPGILTWLKIPFLLSSIPTLPALRLILQWSSAWNCCREKFLLCSFSAFLFLLCRSADTADIQFFHKLRTIYFSGFSPLILEGNNGLIRTINLSVVVTTCGSALSTPFVALLKRIAFLAVENIVAESVWDGIISSLSVFPICGYFFFALGAEKDWKMFKTMVNWKKSSSKQLSGNSAKELAYGHRKNDGSY